MRKYDNYNLQKNNTFGISAKCDQFIEIETAEEAEQYLPFIAKTTKPLMVIGGGSNLLLTKDFSGIILRSAIKGIKIENLENLENVDNSEAPVPGHTMAGSSVLLTAGSGETFDDVIAAALSLGLYGMENLSIIPGDVGASAVQNIGAYGAEAADIIHSIEAVEIKTGKKTIIKAEDCHYAYRQSRFKNEWKGRYFITSVTYRLQTVFTPRLSYGGIQKALDAKGKLPVPSHTMDGPTLTAQDVRQTIIEIRNAKLPDPKQLGNGGSFFMNPIVTEEKFQALLAKYPAMPYYKLGDEAAENRASVPSLCLPSVANVGSMTRSYKIPAGWMIEQCGWKGKSLGNAAVHDKQALVLVNLGNAKGEEILNLCNAVRKSVYERFGIDIHPEVNII